MMEREKIQEGWVVFGRTKCKSGFIDQWLGDVADNPNNEKKSQQQLNSFAMFYRLNGEGKWVSQREFKKGVNAELICEQYNLTAEEIWNSCK